MIDDEKRRSVKQKKESVRRRIRLQVDPDNYEYVPEKKPIERYPEETVKEMTSEEKVLALFGKDSVEIL